TIVNNGDGTWTVLGSHTYTGDTINGESEGEIGRASCREREETTAQVVNDTANISDPNVVTTGGFSFNLTEGSATVTNAVVATFTDPGNPTVVTEEAKDDIS